VWEDKGGTHLCQLRAFCPASLSQHHQSPGPSPLFHLQLVISLSSGRVAQLERFSSGRLSKFICNFHTRTVHHINKQLDGWTGSVTHTTQPPPASVCFTVSVLGDCRQNRNKIIDTQSAFNLACFTSSSRWHRK